MNIVDRRLTTVLPPIPSVSESHLRHLPPLSSTGVSIPETKKFHRNDPYEKHWYPFCDFDEPGVKGVDNLLPLLDKS